MILGYFKLLFVFFKIGALGFGGGYAMMSMIIAESFQFNITAQQFADLTALDMIVPGPIAINAATYVGYLSSGLGGALFATIGVSLPSLIIVTFVMKFIERYRKNKIMNGFLSGVKPAAVGLIAAAAATIASGIILTPGTSLTDLIHDPFGTISFTALAFFSIAAFANIRFKVNPILLTILAGIAGAFLL